MGRGTELLLSAIKVSDLGKARSLQKEIGPSDLGGCRRKVWLKLEGTEPVNEFALLMAAFQGTSWHTGIQGGLERLDPFGDRYLIEREIHALGLVGHLDVFDKLECEAIDWKTTLKKTLGWLTTKGPDGQWRLGAAAANWPDVHQKWQVQTYGLMAEEDGLEVRTVRLVGIARDGNEEHIREWEGEYDPSVAREALAWLEDVKSRSRIPGPERMPSYCARYCQFYSEEPGEGCQGITEVG